MALSISLSVQISCKRNSSLMDEPILMKLLTVGVVNLRMCMGEINPGPKNEDNSREIIILNISREIISSEGSDILCDLTHSSS